MSQRAEQDFLTLEHTLLSYNGEKTVLHIPPEIGQSTIRRIGKGALAENLELKDLWIPESVRQIGEAAVACSKNLVHVFLEGEIPEFDRAVFQGCGNLRQISIRNLPVTEEQYRQLLSNSLTTPRGERIPEQFPSIPGLEGLADALDCGRAAYIPREAPLLIYQAPGSDPESVNSFERDRLIELIRSGKKPRQDRESELANDALLRRGGSVSPEATCFFGITKDEPPVRDGKRLLNAFLRIGCFFWQGAEEICWEGQSYYLYQRNYLHKQASMKYIRRDHGIYTREGRKADEELAREIYAKYQLLSIL